MDKLYFTSEDERPLEDAFEVASDYIEQGVRENSGKCFFEKELPDTRLLFSYQCDPKEPSIYTDRIAVRVQKNATPYDKKPFYQDADTIYLTAKEARFSTGKELCDILNERLTGGAQKMMQAFPKEDYFCNDMDVIIANVVKQELDHPENTSCNRDLLRDLLTQDLDITTCRGLTSGNSDLTPSTADDQEFFRSLDVQNPVIRNTLKEDLTKLYREDPLWQERMLKSACRRLFKKFQDAGLGKDSYLLARTTQIDAGREQKKYTLTMSDVSLVQTPKAGQSILYNVAAIAKPSEMDIPVTTIIRPHKKSPYFEIDVPGDGKMLLVPTTWIPAARKYPKTNRIIDRAIQALPRPKRRTLENSPAPSR